MEVLDSTSTSSGVGLHPNRLHPLVDLQQQQQRMVVVVKGVSDVDHEGTVCMDESFADILAQYESKHHPVVNRKSRRARTASTCGSVVGSQLGLPIDDNEEEQQQEKQQQQRNGRENDEEVEDSFSCCCCTTNASTTGTIISTSYSGEKAKSTKMKNTNLFLINTDSKIHHPSASSSASILDSHSHDTTNNNTLSSLQSIIVATTTTTTPAGETTATTTAAILTRGALRDSKTNRHHDQHYVVNENTDTDPDKCNKNNSNRDNNERVGSCEYFCSTSTLQQQPKQQQQQQQQPLANSSSSFSDCPLETEEQNMKEDQGSTVTNSCPATTTMASSYSAVVEDDSFPFSAPPSTATTTITTITAPGMRRITSLARRLDEAAQFYSAIGEDYQLRQDCDPGRMVEGDEEDGDGDSSDDDDHDDHHDEIVEHDDDVDDYDHHENLDDDDDETHQQQQQQDIVHNTDSLHHLNEFETLTTQPLQEIDDQQQHPNENDNNDDQNNHVLLQHKDPDSVVDEATSGATTILAATSGLLLKREQRTTPCHQDATTTNTSSSSTCQEENENDQTTKTATTIQRTRRRPPPSFFHPLPVSTEVFSAVAATATRDTSTDPSQLTKQQQPTAVATASTDSHFYKGISNPHDITKRGISRGNYAQLHRKAWLEVADKQHRYGKNLRLYYRHWESLGFPTNRFFDWLDSQGEASGQPIPELPECPRSVLDSDTVLYIKDDETTKRTYKLRIECDHQTGKGYVVDVRGQRVKTGPDGWIFVLRDNVLYGARKVTTTTTATTTSKEQQPEQQKQQRFHHSSFFGGKAVAAAGIFVTHSADGALSLVYPHSGHYRPGEADMQRMLFFLQDHAGVDLSTFQVDVQQLIHINRTVVIHHHHKNKFTAATAVPSNTTTTTASLPTTTTKPKKLAKKDALQLISAKHVAHYLSHKARCIHLGIFCQIHKLRSLRAALYQQQQQLGIQDSDSSTNNNNRFDVRQALRVIDP